MTTGSAVQLLEGAALLQLRPPEWQDLQPVCKPMYLELSCSSQLGPEASARKPSYRQLRPRHLLGHLSALALSEGKG